VRPGRHAIQSHQTFRLLENRNVTKLFHFGRFDLAVLYNAFGVMPEPVFWCPYLTRRSAHRNTAVAPRAAPALSST
jgi:ribonuclease D